MSQLAGAKLCPEIGRMSFLYVSLPLSIYLSIHPSIHPSIYLSIHLFFSLQLRRVAKIEGDHRLLALCTSVSCSCRSHPNLLYAPQHPGQSPEFLMLRRRFIVSIRSGVGI